MLLKIKAIAGIIALVLVAVLAGEAAYSVHVTRPKLLETQAALNDMALNLRDYAKDQTEDLRSPRNQKMLEHYFQIGEASLLTIQKINRTTVPALTGAANEMTARLHGLEPIESQLTRTASNFADFIAHSDDSLNKQLMPRIVAIADALKTDVDSIAGVIDGLSLSVKELANLASNPDIPLIIAQFKEASEHVNATTANIEAVSGSASEGMKKFPSLMALFEKYAKASTTWQKRLYLAMIIRQLAAIPLRLP
jgi:Tfp pilus assembly protein PilE